MLPFLKHNNEGSVSLKTGDAYERKLDSEKKYDGLETAFYDLMKAVKSENLKEGASALRAAFSMCESEPDEEGEHE